MLDADANTNKQPSHQTGGSSPVRVEHVCEWCNRNQSDGYATANGTLLCTECWDEIRDENKDCAF